MRTALALSAGGMFGAYQAGVWQALSDVLKPDIVVGASVGALNGWLIAGGCPASALVDRWLQLDTIERLQWRFPRQLSDGCIDSSLLETWIQEMYEACRPKVDYGVVLTELPSLRPKLFRSPDVNWQHLAGSCAVPIFLRHYRIENNFYSDGGLVEPSPAWAAFEMGADVVVSVNLLRRRPPVMNTVVKYLRSWAKFNPSAPQGSIVIDIDPRESLGSAADSMYWSRANAKKWIAAGQKDALAIKQFLVECLDQERATA